jgi:hypothetical protein
VTPVRRSLRKYQARQLLKVAAFYLPVFLFGFVGAALRFIEERTWLSWGIVALVVSTGVAANGWGAAKRALRVRVTPVFREKLKNASYGDRGYSIASALDFIEVAARDAGVPPLSSFGLLASQEWYSSKDAVNTLINILATIEANTQTSSALRDELLILRDCMQNAANNGIECRLLFRFCDRVVSPMDKDLSEGWMPLT